MATSRFVFCGKSRDTWLRYFPGSLEPVWWVGRWGEPEFGQAGRSVWPRTMLRPVVELGVTSSYRRTCRPPQHRCANPITPGWRRERSCSPGSAAAVPMFEACCAAPQQRQPQGLALVADTVVDGWV
jgi:hypothetical protein